MMRLSQWEEARDWSALGQRNLHLVRDPLVAVCGMNLALALAELRWSTIGDFRWWGSTSIAWLSSSPPNSRASWRHGSLLHRGGMWQILGRSATCVLPEGMELQQDVLIKVGLAILVGGLIGAEREYRDKSAGFRTMIFISLGAALFTMHSLSIGVTRDQARIASAIVSGVGFLGGGAIMRGGMNIKGLTTAATIWLTAALGMGIGSGAYGVTLPAAAAVLVVLWFFPFIERWIDDLKTSRVYEATVALDGDAAKQVETTFTELGLRCFPKSRHKDGEHLACSWYVTGSPKSHEEAVAKILTIMGIERLTY